MHPHPLAMPSNVPQVTQGVQRHSSQAAEVALATARRSLAAAVAAPPFFQTAYQSHDPEPILPCRLRKGCRLVAVEEVAAALALLLLLPLL
jgi:hypothetical protein